MSNTRHIDLTKLAEQLTGTKAAAAPPASAQAFPRVPIGRFKELLDEDDDEEVAAFRATLKARLVLPVSGVHLKSRPA